MGRPAAIFRSGSLSSAVVVMCVFTSAMLNSLAINCASGSKNGYKVHKFIFYSFSDK